MTAATPRPDRHAANQRELEAALRAIRAALERCIAQRSSEPEAAPWQAVPGTASASMPSANAPPAMPPALAALRRTFRLSRFECDVLLLCAGVELDGSFPALCAAAQGDPRRTAPTFGLALAVLPDAHWSALRPDGPLRYWRLVDVGEDGIAGHELADRRADRGLVHRVTSRSTTSCVGAGTSAVTAAVTSTTPS